MTTVSPNIQHTLLHIIRMKWWKKKKEWNKYPLNEDERVDRWKGSSEWKRKRGARDVLNVSPVSASPFTLLELLRREVRVRKGNLLQWISWDVAPAELLCGLGEAVWWDRRAIISSTGISARLSSFKEGRLWKHQIEAFGKPSASPGNVLPREAMVRVFRPFKDSRNWWQRNGRESWIKQTLHAESVW